MKTAKQLWNIAKEKGYAEVARILEETAQTAI